MRDMGNTFADAELDGDRDIFLRKLLRELAGILEDAVGLEEAEGFISLVGNRIGAAMNQQYLEAASTEKLDLQQLGDALVDLKTRIQGGFSIESIAPGRIILVNTACPFAEQVVGRESLCMMTSNVFGRIAAANTGYARVELQETIARGDPGCRVVVNLVGEGAGREYYG